MKLIRGVTAGQSVGLFVDMIPDLQKNGYEVVTISSDAPHLQRIRDAGVRTIVVSMERRISLLKDLKSLRQLIKIFRRERPDIVHSMTPKAGLLCMIAGQLTGVPIRIHTFTGLVFPTLSGLKRRVLMATDWLTCVCATHIIPEGEGVKNDLLKNGITKKPLRVLGHGNIRGINLERFNPQLPELQMKAKEFRDESKFTFITIGRIVGDKGINELITALCRLNREMPFTRLILVGGYESELDPITPLTKNEIDKNPCIIHVGIQSDVRPWLAAADCAVLASYREGFPNVVIEAGAMGLPQIVTDINGANEIIIEGKNGTIVPSKSAEALYKAMKKMVTEADWRKSMAANARAMIASRYEQSYVHRCLLDFYHEINN